MKIELTKREIEEVMTLLRARLYSVQKLVKDGVIFDAHLRKGLQVYDKINEQFTKQLPEVK